MRRAGLVAALLLAPAAVSAQTADGGTSRAQRAEAGAGDTEDASLRFRRLLAQAWGPEEPAKLEAFLDVREKLKEPFRRYEEGITQWALREVATRPTLAQSVIGLLQMREVRDAELERVGLTLDDYQRLTMLVYGRWLRAVRDEPAPEIRMLRVLQELDVALERRLRDNPPEDPRHRERVAERLASVRFQARHVAAFAEPDKAAVLKRIDARTAAWLGDNRARIEQLDFGAFDTAAPARPGSVKPRPPAPPEPAAAE